MSGRKHTPSAARPLGPAGLLLRTGYKTVVFFFEETHPLPFRGIWESRVEFKRILFNILYVIFRKFVPPGQTVNNDYYRKILQRLRENLLTQPEVIQN